MKLPLFKITLLVFCLSTMQAFAQGQATKELKITGKVKAERTVTLADLKQYKAVELNNINTSCSPKKEERSKSVKAVLLKHVLDSVSFDYGKSRMLGAYYFVLVASDGYKIVFSFNEIYNTETGNHVYIVTEMDGKPAEETGNSILVLTTKDIKGGSRNLKWLSRIEVRSAD